MNEDGNLNELPAELDNEGVILSYGSLLIHEQLRELLKNRREFAILEAGNLAAAASLVKNNPNDIVILRNVRLENVRVAVVTETMLRRWYKNRGGDLEELIRAGVTTREIPQALFLYARPAERFERGRFLNGGLVFNFRKDELNLLDKYEFEPVLERTLTPELIIENRTYFPKHIMFYAGTESSDDILPEEKTERTGWLNRNRQPGRLSPQARWQRNVRRR